MSTNRKKKVNKYKKQEIKVVLGGFLAIVILTLLLGTVITAKKAPEKEEKTNGSETTQSVSQSEEPSRKAEKEKETTEAKTTEKKAAEEKSTRQNTADEEGKEKKKTEDKAKVDENASPFDPKVISISDENWELTLLDTEHKLPENFVPQLVPAIAGNGEMLDKRVQPYYEKMYNAAKAQGVLLTPYSGYRSYATQARLFTNKVNSYKSQGLSNYEAEKKAAQLCMLPGCSENNLGIAMDICNTNEDFNLTEQYAWLQKHAAEYGFIERYKEEKTEQTGVAAAPWHWRFVGVENAKAMNEGGLCLEEYLKSSD